MDYVLVRDVQGLSSRQYSTWHGSYHRTMTQVATPETVRADFDGVTVAGVHGRRCADAPRRRVLGRVRRSGLERRAGAASAGSNGQVVMITGSHHQQVYWYATGTNRLLGQLPGVYLIRRTALDSAPRRGPASADRSSLLRDRPLEQHLHRVPRDARQAGVRDAVWSRSRSTAQVVDTTVAEFGIACEACHGPSARTRRGEPQSAAPLRASS